MWSLFHSILLYYFNTIGLLSLKRSTVNGLITLKTSNFYGILNCLKASILMYFKNSIFELMDDCYTVGLEVEYSTFSNVTYSVNGNILMLTTFSIILVQFWRKEETMNLLNDVLMLKHVSIKTFMLKESFYQEFRRNCIKDVLKIIIAFVIVFTFDYLSTMNHNWLSLVSYVLYILPEVVNISMIVFMYILTQFVVTAQKILNSYLSESVNENYIEQYAVYTMEVFRILRQMLKIMNLQCLFLTCYLFIETLVQVS